MIYKMLLDNVHDKEDAKLLVPDHAVFDVNEIDEGGVILIMSPATNFEVVTIVQVYVVSAPLVLRD